MTEFYPCEPEVPFDNGQDDVTDGSVENYDFDWNDEEVPTVPKESTPEN